MSFMLWFTTILIGYAAGGSYWSGVAFTLTGMACGFAHWRNK